MKSIHLSTQSPSIKGEITLPGSKSIANRALIIRALCEDDFEIENLSSAKDTQTLIQLLSTESDVLDAGPAGTTFRFMTAYLALQEGTTILTGSERMKQRPIGVLVEALKELGADIEYMEKEGYPPLKIHSPKGLGITNEITMAADISSQYISALLMIAPTLPNGLTIHFKGEPVSLPYIRMTLRMMEYFGATYEEKGNSISVSPSVYIGKPFKVEADWSAASYYFSLAALADEADIQVNGLFEKSLQGDVVIAQISTSFGMDTFYNENGIRIVKAKRKVVSCLSYDFTECPDIAQTVAVICGGLGTAARFTGLKTLRIKETDRIEALRIELAKVGVKITPLDLGNDQGMDIIGKAKIAHPTFATYEDHRMAMAFAPLALLGKITIEEPDVVKKSYPEFWDDLNTLGIKS
jgi:3-phosphoshikimate 1-carboxyvinyltransferase